MSERVNGELRWMPYEESVSLQGGFHSGMDLLLKTLLAPMSEGAVAMLLGTLLWVCPAKPSVRSMRSMRPNLLCRVRH